MSVAIIGGNECMVRKYEEICKGYNCEASVFTKPKGMKSKKGKPDLVILFTNTVSHKMIEMAKTSFMGHNPLVVRSHSSSASSLKRILEENI